jgi:hypothetical protein
MLDRQDRGVCVVDYGGWRIMVRVVCLFFVVLALFACGGDDDSDGEESSGASTSVATSVTEPLATTTPTTGSQLTPAAGRATETATRPNGQPTPTAADEATATLPAGGDAREGVPTPEDPNFPDVYASLAPGSSAEADTGEDPFTKKPGRARYTIDAITDPAEPANQIYVPQAGNRWVLFEITVAAIGEGGLSTPEWALGTTDGKEYDWIGGTGLGQEILFMDLPAGESLSGVVVFEIPADAEVAWLMIDPSIYVGRNLIFVVE